MNRNVLNPAHRLKKTGWKGCSRYVVSNPGRRTRMFRTGFSGFVSSTFRKKPFPSVSKTIRPGFSSTIRLTWLNPTFPSPS